MVIIQVITNDNRVPPMSLRVQYTTAVSSNMCHTPHPVRQMGYKRALLAMNMKGLSLL